MSKPTFVTDAHGVPRCDMKCPAFESTVHGQFCGLTDGKTGSAEVCIPALHAKLAAGEDSREAFRWLISNLDTICCLVELDCRIRENIQNSIKVAKALAAKKEAAK